MVYKKIEIFYWTRNMTVYNMTKDLYKDNINQIIVGAFDLIKYRDVIKALENKVDLNKYFGFESLKIQMSPSHPLIKRN